MRRRRPALKQVLDTQAMPWRDFEEAPGVRYKVLRHHSGQRGITLLLHFSPGAHYPVHRHPEGEEYYVLEGSLRDGEHVYGPHTYVYQPPGSVHRPSSPDGCLLLVTLPVHVERLDART